MFAALRGKIQISTTKRIAERLAKKNASLHDISTKVCLMSPGQTKHDDFIER